MTKKEFLKTKASTNIKTVSLISWIVLVLCVFTMGYGIYNTHHGDIREIPAFKAILGDSVDELNEELEISLENDKMLLSHEHQAAENLSEKFSFSNFLIFAEITDDSDIDALSDIVSIFLSVVTVAAIVSAAITLLAVIFKNNIVLIFSILLSVATTFISGTLPLVLTVVLHIALFIFFLLINTEYKKYKNA